MLCWTTLVYPAWSLFWPSPSSSSGHRSSRSSEERSGTRSASSGAPRAESSRKKRLPPSLRWSSLSRSANMPNATPIKQIKSSLLYGEWLLFHWGSLRWGPFLAHQWGPQKGLVACSLFHPGSSNLSGWCILARPNSIGTFALPYPIRITERIYQKRPYPMDTFPFCLTKERHGTTILQLATSRVHHYI